jgi:hypothetical protein
MAKYTVIIQEHSQEADTKRVWSRLRDCPDEPGGDTHGYAPPSGNVVNVTSEIYKQDFDELDIKKTVTNLNSRY